MIFFLIFVVFVLLIYFFYYSNQSLIPHGLKKLPMEKGIPILGITPYLKPNVMLYLANLSRKHGPIYMVKIGLKDVVVLNDFDTIKKSLKDCGDNFVGKYEFQCLSLYTQKCGIIFTEGENWAKQRSFILTVLRDFGLGKTKFLDIIQNECQFLIEELETWNGKSVDFSQLIPIYTSNVISKFIINKRFSRDDPKIKYIADFILKFGKQSDLLSWTVLMFPILNDIIIFNMLMNKITFREMTFANVCSSFEKDIEDHRKRLDFSSDGEDLIDRFLIKQHEMREKTGTDGVYTDSQMIQNSFELFMAGSETTSTLLVWSFFFMSKFQDIQEKVYLEIVDKIGNERMATINDKKDLIYSLAVMDEIMRLGTVVIILTRRTFTDTSVNGFFIPKNTFIIPNLLACHLDPDIWENPWEFRPDRFLTVDSNGNSKYSPREELIPFSLGRRQCPGESFARIEYFIFFISVLQKFKVNFSREISDKEYKENLLGNNGIIRFSKIKDFIFSLRNEDM